MIAYDAGTAPLEIISLEKVYGANFTIPGCNLTVRLSGTIDRVDKTGAGEIRIIDYKTGSDKKVVKSLEDLFTRDHPSRLKGIFQTFVYAALFDPNQEEKNRILPGIIDLKNIYSDSFDPAIKILDQSVDFHQIRDEFMSRLNGLMNDIFCEEHPIEPTEELKICKLCDYKMICRRPEIE
jgi:ATP-dependent helicase/DNAse subunit B